MKDVKIVPFKFYVGSCLDHRLLPTENTFKYKNTGMYRLSLSFVREGTENDIPVFRVSTSEIRLLNLWKVSGVWVYRNITRNLNILKTPPPCV